MTIWIDQDNCDGCKRCQRVCPYEGIELMDGVARVTDRCTSCGACVEACKNEAITSDITPRQVPDFSEHKGVWVFAEQTDGVLAAVGLELLGKARELARDLNETVSAVLMGQDLAGLCDTLAVHGADTIYLVEDPLLKAYRTIAHASVMETLIKKYRPSILLIGATALGRDLAPRVSRRVGAGLTADCTELSIDMDEGSQILWQTRPAFGGNIMATIANRYSRPQMATVRPGVMEKTIVENVNAEIIRISPTLNEGDIKTRILERVKELPKGTDITQANVIVAGGRGIKGKEGFEMLRELAALLGGELACTRLIVEQGIMAQRSQVGQTGKTVRPEIYIACGISGAIQHRAGMMGSRYIIAINTDPKAPIFDVANWGIVGDVHEIVPEMIAQLSPKGSLS
ncbi:MAG: electron transfer flavoprotein subunit alpha [Proteobacteria bacterium]|nr:electron transfer flavoprotein subunit alpha [Pseudomonadota bacterium]